MSRLQVQSHSLVLLEGLGDLIGALRRGRGHCYVVRTCSRVQHAQGDTDKDQQTNRPTITIHSTLFGYHNTLVHSRPGRCALYLSDQHSDI